MLNIETEIFCPVEKSPEFRVHLRGPSFTEFQDAQIDADKQTPSGGPNGQRGAASYKILAERLMDLCIVKIEGLQVDGKAIECSQDFRSKAPKYLADKVAMRLLFLANPEVEEIKN